MNSPSPSRFWIQTALAVLACAIGSVSAQTSGTFGNFHYEDGGVATPITGYVTAPIGEMVIPETINGKPVTSIGNSAFDGCRG